jgi:hypothetical protein
MKRLIAFAILGTSLLSSCYHDPQSSTTVGNDIKIEFLFEHDGIRMYRFNDGHFHYFTSQGTTLTSQSAGKSHYEETITPPIDTVEKHFDCTIAEVIGTREMPPFAYVTECGIMFYSDNRYKLGQVIKGFRSPKHK